MVACVERGADLHMAQLMPLPLTVSCFSKIQIGFAFLVLAHPSSPPGQRTIKRVCVDTDSYSGDVLLCNPHKLALRKPNLTQLNQTNSSKVCHKCNTR